MPTVTKPRKSDIEPRYGTKTWAIGINIDTYDQVLKPLVDRHRSSNKQVIEALIDYIGSLPTEKQAALIRGELNEKPKK